MRTSLAKQPVKAYERLLLDAMSGAATPLCGAATRAKKLATLIDPIEEAWHAKKDDAGVIFLSSRSWGPEVPMIARRDGHAWRRL